MSGLDEASSPGLWSYVLWETWPCPIGPVEGCIGSMSSDVEAQNREGAPKNVGKRQTDSK